MYNSILESLYHGEINLNERKAICTPPKDEIERKIQAEKEYFHNEFSPDVCKRLEKLENLYTEAFGIENIEIFTHGFKIGALMMLEILEEVSVRPLHM